MNGDGRAAVWSSGPGLAALPGGTALATAFLAGGVAVLVAATAVGLARAVGVEVDLDRAGPTRLALSTVTTVAGAALLATAVARTPGERNEHEVSRWAALAALSYGLAAVAVPEVIGPIAAGDPAPVLPSVSAAGQATALALFAGGALAIFVRLRVALRWLALGAAGMVAALTVTFFALPAVGSALAVDRFGSDDAPTTAVLVIVIAAWLGLGAAYTVWAVTHRWQHGWCGLLMLSLTMANLAEAMADGPADPWWSGAAALAATGMVAATAIAALEAARDGGRVHAAPVAMGATPPMPPLGALPEPLAPDGARSPRAEVADAMRGIERAAVTLERHATASSDEVPVRRAVEAGIERLRALLRPQAADAPAGEGVDLAEVARGAVAELGWRDRVTVEIADGTAGVGSRTDLREVVGLLLANADRRSPIGRITVRGGREDGWAILRVDDTGAPIDREERRALLDGPDGRASTAGRADVGVAVATRLMREQGGDLWIEPRPEGGCSFAVCLPAAPAPVASGPAPES